jgi:hypothetical protein
VGENGHHCTHLLGHQPRVLRLFRGLNVLVHVSEFERLPMTNMEALVVGWSLAAISSNEVDDLLQNKNNKWPVNCSGTDDDF